MSDYMEEAQSDNLRNQEIIRVSRTTKIGEIYNISENLFHLDTLWQRIRGIQDQLFLADKTLYEQLVAELLKTHPNAETIKMLNDDILCLASPRLSNGRLLEMLIDATTGKLLC